MPHYIAVSILRPEGGWRVYFPDFPGCRADAASLQVALHTGRRTICQRARMTAREGAVPFPRSLQAIVADPDWARTRGIDWRQVVISLVPLVTPPLSNCGGVFPPRNAAE
jgi:hypothetical protein